MSDKKDKQVFTQTVLVDFSAVLGQKPFNLFCPFIPKSVRVSALLGSFSSTGVALGPVNPGPVPTDVFLISLSFLPPNSYIACTMQNTLLHDMNYSNITENTFQGTFYCNGFNSCIGAVPTPMAQMNGGSVILTFSFYSK